MTRYRDTVTITDVVAAVTSKALLLKQCAQPSWAKHDQEWIAKSQIEDCDAELDEIAVGDEITIEIPRWLARKIGVDE